MSTTALCLILFTVTLSACAQVVLKLGVTRQPMADALQSGVMDSFFSALSSPLIWFGLIIYFFCVGLWLWVLSKVDLSVAYPFVGVSFIVTMIFGAFLLKEDMSYMRIMGTLFVVAGCILITRSA